MGEYGQGVHYAQSSAVDKDTMVSAGILGGKLRVMQDYYVLGGATSMTSNEYLLVGEKLPTGSQVVDIILSNGGVGTGTDSYLCVGDEGDADRYITKVQSTTAAVTTAINAYSGMNYYVTGVTDNYIRITGSASSVCINSAGTIKISILYVVE